MALQYLCFGRSKKQSSSSKRPYPTVIEELCTRFSLADITKATNNFDRNNVIGRGGFGRLVYKGCLLLDHVATSVALKKIDKPSSLHVPKAFKTETELLCQLRHPNLISLIGFCIDKYSTFIVYEYMSNGSLADCLFKRGGGREALSWKKRLEICIGAARGLHYLHSGLKRTIIHRDIKPSNILLDDNMVPKLSDFGISVRGALFTEKPEPIQVDLVDFETTGIYGTQGYMAPEYFLNGTVTDQYDVYSFGVVLLQVVCAESMHTIMVKMYDYQQQSEEMSNIGSEPPDNITMHSYIMLKLQAEDIDPAIKGNIAPLCYAVYIDIIDRCLKDEPDERPIMGEVEVLLEYALSLQHEADNAREHTTSITQPQQQEARINLISS